jgi:glutamate/tyrosine decarboxylase-like PLP-dependent enzyme
MAIGAFTNTVRWAAQQINTCLHGTSPTTIIGTTLVAYIALKKLSQLSDARTRNWLWHRFAHRLLQVETFQALLQKKLDVQFAESAESIKKKWAPFGDPVRTLPENGATFAELMALIQRYNEITQKGLQERQYSGTIYPKATEDLQIEAPKAPKNKAEELLALFTTAFRCANLWNPLHTTEFPVGSFLEYQVVQMVASLFGGKDVAGVVTSGGTESLMTAAKGYRNWGLERGIPPGESVIIAPDSIHASLKKAANDYHIRLILIPTDEEGRVDMDALENAIEKHRSNLVALFCSAPSYPKGRIDPVEQFGVLASEYGVGCHVDCCVSLFLINYHPKLVTNYFANPGITSISGDPHKNGWAPKGTSVIAAKEVPGGKNLCYYFTYAIPEWTGGVYGTSKTAGSHSCMPALTAFLAMMSIGNTGYRQIAEEIIKAASGMATIVKAIPGLKLLGEPDLNIVAFKVDPQLGLMAGATYVFAKEMSERGFVLSALKGDAVHFCITGRFVGDKTALTRFEAAARVSLEAVQKLNGELIKRGQKFAGDAGMYCQLEAAMEPKRETQGWAKYIENVIFGEIGAQAAVKTYLLANLNPWRGKVASR